MTSGAGINKNLPKIVKNDLYEAANGVACDSRSSQTSQCSSRLVIKTKNSLVLLRTL